MQWAQYARVSPLAQRGHAKRRSGEDGLGWAGLLGLAELSRARASQGPEKGQGKEKARTRVEAGKDRHRVIENKLPAECCLCRAVCQRRDLALEWCQDEIPLGELGALFPWGLSPLSCPVLSCPVLSCRVPPCRSVWQPISTQNSRFRCGVSVAASSN